MNIPKDGIGNGFLKNAYAAILSPAHSMNQFPYGQDLKVAVPYVDR